MTHPGVKYEVVFGVSDSNWPLYDLDHGRRSVPGVQIHHEMPRLDRRIRGREGLGLLDGIDELMGWDGGLRDLLFERPPLRDVVSERAATRGTTLEDGPCPRRDDRGRL